MNFRKTLVKIGFGFFTILLALIFSSGTISKFSLPSVSVDTLQELVVNKQAWGYGYAAFSDVETYWADRDGKIQWYVQDGDTIEPGQALFTITGDNGQEQHAYYEGEESGLVGVERLENPRKVAEGTKLLSVNRLNRAYTVDAIIADNPDFLQIGTGATLTMTQKGKTIDIGGVVKKVYIDAGEQHAVIHFTADGLTGGEYIRVLVQTPRELEPTVLPSAAVRTDGRDQYVFYVERQQGRFSEEYYIRKMTVTVTYVYDGYTALAYYDPVQYPFVMNSDRLIQEGDRVNIVNGSDFFEGE